MVFAAEEAIMTWVLELVLETVKARVEYTSESYFLRLRINNQITNAVAQVIEPLLPFLKKEGLDEEKQRLLVDTCILEMRELLKEPARLFEGSLNGAKLFQQMYAGRQYPEAIRDEGLEGIYERLGPQIGSLLCEIPFVVNEWKLAKWQEDYRRLDELALQLRKFFESFDAEKKTAVRESDDVLRRLLQALELRERMQVDLAGLRSEQPLIGKLAQMFIHPELTNVVRPKASPDDDGPTTLRLENEAQALDHFLCNGRRAILTGPPGSGKSTWTKWLQRQAWGDKWHRAAIRIELRRLATGELPSYMKVLCDAAGPNLAVELSPDRVRGWVKSGRLAFLLDGFDELPLDRRDDLRQWIQELSNEVGQCPVVVTSRPITSNHLENFAAQWERFSVGEFDLRRIVDYIRAWYEHAPRLADTERTVNAESLAETWQRDSTLRPLTGNPLLLSTLLVVHHHDGRLPTGRARLYARYVDGMLGGWDSRRQVEAERFKLATPQKRRILRRLALRMHLDSQVQLEERQAQSIIAAAMKDLNINAEAAMVLDELRERSGLLMGPGIYCFAHKSIGEFLVAEAIAEANEKDGAGCRLDRMALYQHRHEDRWLAIMFFWAGIAPAGEAEDFVRLCLREADWNNLLLAMSLVDDQGESLALNLKDQVIEACVELSKSTSIEKHLSQSSAWTWSGGKDDWAIHLRMLQLPGLRGRDANRVMGEWHAAGHFSWDKVREAQSHVSQLFWAACVESPKSAAEWHQLLCDAPLPAGGFYPTHPSSRWIVPLYIQFQLASAESRLPIREAITIYHQVVPPSGHVVPLLLVLLVLQVDASMKWSTSSSRLLASWTERLRRTVEIAAEFRDLALSDDWLVLTGEFPVEATLGYRGVKLDILQTCKDVIVARIADGALESSSHTENVIATLERMIARRTAVLTESGSPQAAAHAGGQTAS